jgi:hypothetical protein
MVKLTFPKFDARAVNYVEVVDEETGRSVGYINAGGVGFAGNGGILIDLFGGKYTGYFNRYDECVGFIKGVQSVLNHLAKHLTDTVNANQIVRTSVA